MERDVWRTRLLHIKGKRNVRCSEVKLEVGAMNTGDVFILDLGLELFVYNGPEANRMERAKGLETVTRIKVRLAVRQRPPHPSTPPLARLRRTPTAAAAPRSPS